LKATGVNNAPRRRGRSGARDDGSTVIYARVSSREQEKEGFSIPAQLKLLKE
jgi:site-specific DNA recombinase